MSDTSPGTPAPAEDAAAKLAEIRLVLDAFEWGSDDLQYAMEQIDDIVNRASHSAGSTS